MNLNIGIGTRETTKASLPGRCSSLIKATPLIHRTSTSLVCPQIYSRDVGCCFNNINPTRTKWLDVVGYALSTIVGILKPSSLSLTSYHDYLLVALKVQAFKSQTRPNRPLAVIPISGSKRFFRFIQVSVDTLFFRLQTRVI